MRREIPVRLSACAILGMIITASSARAGSDIAYQNQPIQDEARSDTQAVSQVQAAIVPADASPALYWTTGACCIDWNCLGTMTLLECDALGGDWYIGEDCDTFDCPWACPESILDIAILTDNYGDETTWEITEHDTGVVKCSGGPYDSNTFYKESVCIDYDDCVDFTIYDSYGDGICCTYGEGYYEVYLDGELVGAGGDFDASETVAYIGDGCVISTGACCVGMECVATNYEYECDALVGRWYEYEQCPDFECPPCWDFEITAPYISESISTCGRIDDCSPPEQYYDTEDVVFKVEIPVEGLWSFNTCPGYGSGFDTWIALGSDCCLSDLAYNDDGCGLQSEIIIYLPAGAYYVDIEGYNTCGEFILEVKTAWNECWLACPEDGDDENEPCGQTRNDGCDLDPPTFEPIACRQTICGTAWRFDDSDYDSDWYEFIAPADSHMTFTVNSEFRVEFGLMEQIEPGLPGCENLTGGMNPHLSQEKCYEDSIEFDVVAGGVYYLRVAPQSGCVFDCDEEEIMYVAQLAGDNCLCGDFDLDGDLDIDDFYILIGAFGLCSGDAGYEDACDFDDDGCITLVDFGMWIRCYRDADG